MELSSIVSPVGYLNDFQQDGEKVRQLSRVLFTFIFVFGVGFLFVWSMVLSQKPTRSDAPTEVAHEELDLSLESVRVQGLAHYDVVVKQTVRGNLFVDDRVYYVFGFFAPGDTDSRGIQVLIRSERKPEVRVNFEYMTVEGSLQPMRPDIIPYGIETEFGNRGDYFFAGDVLILEPWTVEVDEEVWDRDAP